jgi:hypothetical protein
VADNRPNPLHLHRFVFADRPTKGYFPQMALRDHCRLIAFLTAVLFGLSTLGHGVTMAETVMKPMAAAAAGMASPDHSMDCDGDDGAKQAACFATCASVIGILWDAVPMPLTFAAGEVLAPAVLPLADHGRPPDPHPPKPPVLI